MCKKMDVEAEIKVRNQASTMQPLDGGPPPFPISTSDVFLHPSVSFVGRRRRGRRRGSKAVVATAGAGRRQKRSHSL